MVRTLWSVNQDLSIPAVNASPDFLGVKRSASQEDINKAFRKKSRLMHPDKAKQSLIASKAQATYRPNVLGQNKKPGVHVSKGPSESEFREAVKKASERFARLGVIANILKGSSRERYDHFLNHGFPKWKGTGYYYARFRPGLGSVLVGLFVIGGGLVHYVVIYLSWKRQKEFVERFIRHARRAAWGDDFEIKGMPGLGDASSMLYPSPEDGAMMLNRRQKRLQEKESRKEKEKKKPQGTLGSGASTSIEPNNDVGPQGLKKRVQAENGKVLIVDSMGNVFLEEEDENGGKGEYLLDPDEILKPAIQQTILFRLPVWFFSQIKDRLNCKAKSEIVNAEDDVINEDGSNLKYAIDARSKEKGPAKRRGKRNT